MKKFRLSEKGTLYLMSVVTEAEARSLAYQLYWGDKKQEDLQNLLRKIPIADINHPSIIQAYAEIDAYSQGKLINKPLPPKMTARNLGKNDLWIAATASVLGLTLISTDKDFKHLAGKFISFEWIDPDQT